MQAFLGPSCAGPAFSIVRRRGIVACEQTRTTTVPVIVPVRFPGALTAN